MVDAFTFSNYYIKLVSKQNEIQQDGSKPITSITFLLQKRIFKFPRIPAYFQEIFLGNIENQVTIGERIYHDQIDDLMLW